jgi:hypothetical protein
MADPVGECKDKAMHRHIERERKARAAATSTAHHSFLFFNWTTTEFDDAQFEADRDASRKLLEEDLERCQPKP